MAAVVVAVKRNAAKNAYQQLDDPDGARPVLPRQQTVTIHAEPLYLEEVEGLPFQRAAYHFYRLKAVEYFVASLICLNFIVNITEKEVDPYPEGEQLYADKWLFLSDIFNILFLGELLVNIYGTTLLENGCSQFWKSGWNVFDFIVVAIGCLSLFRVPLGPLKLLRNVRAFRIFRLLRKVESLNKILTSIVKAIPGVFNAFLIMVIFMCIYAILAVEFFSRHGSEGTYVTTHEAEWGVDYSLVSSEPSSMTARGYTFGEEYFGCFSRAMWTLFQVVTGDSWSEAIARPLMFGSNPKLTAVYYTSFIIIMQIILVNVVVAVLLDKMVEAPDPPPKPEPKEGPAEGEEEAAPSNSSGPSGSWQQEMAELRSDVKALRDDMKALLSQGKSLSA